MPWKLILFLLSLLVLLVFAAFNMNNVSDISFGFYELKDVPVFVSLLFSFILGVLFSLPFIYAGKKSAVKKKKIKEEFNIEEPLKNQIKKAPPKNIFSGFSKKKKEKGKIKTDDISKNKENSL